MYPVTNHPFLKIVKDGSDYKLEPFMGEDAYDKNSSIWGFKYDEVPDPAS